LSIGYARVLGGVRAGTFNRPSQRMQGDEMSLLRKLLALSVVKGNTGTVVDTPNEVEGKSKIQ
jgi:hypothetical protein